VIAGLEKVSELKITPAEIARLKVIQSQIFAKILRLHHLLLVEEEEDETCFRVTPLMRTGELYILSMTFDLTQRIRVREK